MQEHSVPVAHLVFPVLLPFAQGVFLKEAVCSDNEHWGCCLEAYAALDTYDGVTHMAVAANAVGSANLLYSLNSLNLIVVLHTVHAAQLTLLEAQLQGLRTFLGWVLQISALWQTLL